MLALVDIVNRENLFASYKLLLQTNNIYCFARYEYKCPQLKLILLISA
jgi:hypothetical protein